VDKLLCHQGGTIPTNQAISIILQVLDALDYAHQVEVPRVQLKDGKVGRGCGLVHRDLKPSNIFLSRSGGSVTAKVGDYGLAKAFDLAGLSGHTCTGAVAGTAQFMPRQQVLEFRESKPEVDVWAAAASLYCMLTGCSPRDFPKGPDPWAIVLETQAVPICQRNSAIPSRLAQVIDEALVDKPEIRIKTARDLKRALKGAI
jgi:serine/threonine protein kinase